MAENFFKLSVEAEEAVHRAEAEEHAGETPALLHCAHCGGFLAPRGPNVFCEACRKKLCPDCNLAPPCNGRVQGSGFRVQGQEDLEATKDEFERDLPVTLGTLAWALAACVGLAGVFACLWELFSGRPIF